MPVRTLAKRAEELHAAERGRWVDAWGAFWRRVYALEPEAAAALDALTRAASDAELDAWADGSAPIFGPVNDALTRWAEELRAELGPDPDEDAWRGWLAGTVDALDGLPRGPGAAERPGALRLWPSTVPPSPPLDAERNGAERAYLLRRLSDARAADDAAETMAAGIALERLGIVAALAELTKSGGRS